VEMFCSFLLHRLQSTVCINKPKKFSLLFGYVSQLDEVVVVGYGNRKKSHTLTGSIAKIAEMMSPRTVTRR
jgi:hypothetical protein